MPYLELVNLTKRYGSVIAVDRVNLDVERGEIVTLLGPSGCGKTTILRMIAGLTCPDEGDIYIEGVRVTDTPPEKRGVGMVFQNYALWPHMTVYENIAFGLRLKKLPKSEIDKRVKEVLELVRMSGLENRYPRQLSGGQQQRVALARALALEPKILLLDEPLSNLDAKLREEMRFELRDLIKKMGITAVYVTHDQAEALAISDRIAVMNRGRIVQVGAPEEIYNNPANSFVASFIGLSNILEGVVMDLDEERGRAMVRLEDGNILKVVLRDKDGAPASAGKVLVMVRPENIKIVGGKETKHESNVFAVKIVKKTYFGDTIEYRVLLGGREVRVRSNAEERYGIGDIVRIWIDPEKVVLLTE